MYVCEKLKSKEGDNRSGYTMIRALATFILIIGLGISAYQDWKSREVKDWIWITLLVIGLLINVFVLWDSRDRFQVLTSITLSIIIVSSLGFILWYLFLWGGGDLLVFIAASLVAATLPISYLSPNSYEVLPFGISALTNAYLVTIILPGYLLIKNIYRRFIIGEALFHGIKASIAQKLFVSLIGSPVNPKSLKSDHISFYTILEEKNDGIWKFKFHEGIKNNEEAMEAHKLKILKDLENDSKPFIWISYTLPFLIPLMIGFIITATIGTILFRLWILFQALG